MRRTKVSNWLVCYDIADPGRLNTVHRIVSKSALMLQFSVYYLRASEDGLDNLLDSLVRSIKHKEDDIRVYPIPEVPNAMEAGHDIIARAILCAGAVQPLVLSDEHDTTPESTVETGKGHCNELKVKENNHPGVETETR